MGQPFRTLQGYVAMSPPPCCCRCSRSLGHPPPTALSLLGRAMYRLGPPPVTEIRLGNPFGNPHRILGYKPTCWAVRRCQSILADLGSIPCDGSWDIGRRLTLRVLGGWAGPGPCLVLFAENKIPPITISHFAAPRYGTTCGNGACHHCASGTVVARPPHMLDR